MKLKKYDDTTLKHIHDVELMILKDLIRFCDENGLTYFMYAGSLLGAIRHNGFIPWDDDLDVCMLRNEFERFKKLFSSNEKYDLLSIESQEDYPYLFAKLNLKNTRFEEKGALQLDFTIGINIDIFVLDDLADNKYKRFYQLKKAFLYNRLLIVSKIRIDDLPVIPKLISNTAYHILNILKLNPTKINKKCLNFLSKYSDANAKNVFDISAMAHEYPLIYDKSDFKEVEKVQFEDIYVNVPKNYDKILTELYGDYMVLPPEEKRYNHPIDFIDFGKY
ncbi:phosphorylcholine transferase LicD [Methanobrevibacter sp.]|uniref:LicD family protein n=1 Tax=Methanobrevibacter sp. TaxID=66852 RepID=UPI00386E223A